jgi:hypothetical protein
MFLKGIFAEGHVAPLADLQIYPSINKVSFKVVKEVVRDSGSA